MYNLSLKTTEACLSLPVDMSASDFQPVVVNPVVVSYWLEIVLPAKSFAPVVTRTLYVVFKEKLLLGLVLKIVLPAEVVVKVVVIDVVLSEDELSEVELSELVEDDICMQVLKLSVETWMVPEQVVSKVLVLNVELSIGSEKVTEMVVLSEDTDVVVSAGETDDTDGAVVSNLKA